MKYVKSETFWCLDFLINNFSGLLLDNWICSSYIALVCYMFCVCEMVVCKHRPMKGTENVFKLVCYMFYVCEMVVCKHGPVEGMENEKIHE